jgi:hypothetical protein
MRARNKLVNGRQLAAVPFRSLSDDANCHFCQLQEVSVLANLPFIVTTSRKNFLTHATNHP